MSKIEKPTPYTIEQNSATFTVLKDEKIVAKGLFNEEEALIAIHCLEGKVYDDFYVVDADGKVTCVDRGSL
jgi:hypothetical protein